MSLSVSQFLQALADSELMSEADINSLNERTSETSGTADDLAQELVAAARLTAFQSEALLTGNSPPLVLGNYVLLDRIGAGGMGQVFKARHRRMEREVALKILPSAATDSPELVQRFHREVKAVAKLSHPHIVTAHDADEAKGVHYLVMEHVSGLDLGRLVKKHGVLPPQRGGRLHSASGARPGVCPPQGDCASRHQTVESVVG